MGLDSVRALSNPLNDMRYRRRRRHSNPASLSPEQHKQKREWLLLRLRADVIALGVSKYLDLDTPTSEEMLSLGQILLDAGTIAEQAETGLEEIYAIEAIEEPEPTNAPN
jgi:hypothetical protein